MIDVPWQAKPTFFWWNVIHDASWPLEPEKHNAAPQLDSLSLEATICPRREERLTPSVRLPPLARPSFPHTMHRDAPEDCPQVAG